MSILITIGVTIVAILIFIFVINATINFFINRDLSNYRWEYNERTNDYRARDKRTGRFIND